MNIPPLYGLWSEKYQRWFTDSSGLVFNTQYPQLAIVQRDTANKLRGDPIGAHPVKNDQGRTFGVGMDYEDLGHWSIRNILELFPDKPTEGEQ